MKKSEFVEFKKAFEEIAIECKVDECLPIIKIDAEINNTNMTKETIEQLNLLEPFGEANKTPIFIYKDLKIDSIRSLSDGKHLKMTLKDGNAWLDAIGFNMGDLAQEYLIGNKVDVVGVLEINSFNNKENIQINLKDVRKSYT